MANQNEAAWFHFAIVFGYTLYWLKRTRCTRSWLLSLFLPSPGSRLSRSGRGRCHPTVAAIFGKGHEQPSCPSYLFRAVWSLRWNCALKCARFLFCSPWLDTQRSPLRCFFAANLANLFPLLICGHTFRDWPPTCLTQRNLCCSSPG